MKKRSKMRLWMDYMMLVCLAFVLVFAGFSLFPALENMDLAEATYFDMIMTAAGE